jgi:STE24 endopeptidase
MVQQEQHAPAEPFPLPEWDHVKARRYSRIQLAWTIGETAFGVASLAWLALSGRSASLRRRLQRTLPDERLVVPAYLAVLTTGSWLVHLPLAACRDLLIERAFGLTHQSPRTWLSDAIKSLALNLGIAVPVASGAWIVVQRRPRDWWLILPSAFVPVLIVAGRLAPVLIMPLFNRFDPVTDPEILARLQTLASRAGIEIAAVYRMDMSRQTDKPNAFFAGLGGAKRIVLSDTLLEHFPPDEIETIVAHELGHQVRGDLWRMMAVTAAGGYGVAFLTSRLAPILIAVLRRRTGVHDMNDVAAMPVVGLAASLAGLVATPISAAISRAMERQADRFALDMTCNGRAYASALRRIAAKSLADPSPPRLVRIVLATHPPISERIASATAYKFAKSNV